MLQIGCLNHDVCGKRKLCKMTTQMPDCSVQTNGRIVILLTNDAKQLAKIKQYSTIVTHKPQYTNITTQLKNMKLPLYGNNDSVLWLQKMIDAKLYIDMETRYKQDCRRQNLVQMTDNISLLECAYILVYMNEQNRLKILSIFMNTNPKNKRAAATYNLLPLAKSKSVNGNNFIPTQSKPRVCTYKHYLIPKPYIK